MALWDPKAGGRVLCPHTSSTGVSLVPLPAFQLFLESPSCLVLEEGRGSGTEKPRFRGLGEEAATHLEAVAAATGVPSSWPCWAANRGEDDQRQSPSQTGASFAAPLSHNDMETQVSVLTHSSGGEEPLHQE